MPTCCLTPYTIDRLFIGNDNPIRVEGLHNPLSPGTWINIAVVTVTLVDVATGLPVAGQVWPLLLPWVTGSNGDYVGVLEDTLVLTDRQHVQAQVHAEVSGLTARWTVDLYAEPR